MIQDNLTKKYQETKVNDMEIEKKAAAKVMVPKGKRAISAGGNRSVFLLTLFKTNRNNVCD